MAIANKFINVKLDWALAQLESWRTYIDAHPFEKMEDRIRFKETKGGGLMPVVIASIEAQQKNSRDMMKDYLSLLEVVKKLKAEETEKEEETYGDTVVSPRMKLHEGTKDEG